jgi:hypothetical protein
MVGSKGDATRSGEVTCALRMPTYAYPIFDIHLPVQSPTHPPGLLRLVQRRRLFPQPRPFCWFHGHPRKRSKSNTPATECQKPHTFVLHDGHKYDITSMADDHLLELVEFAKNGSTAADVPEAHTIFARVRLMLAAIAASSSLRRCQCQISYGYLQKNRTSIASDKHKYNTHSLPQHIY